VLLFDEPTAALDPEHQIRIYDLIEGAARGGKAVLVATHELWLAGRYATRIVLLDRGRVVADGPPRAVLTRAVLEPVYGPCLAYREAPGGGAGPLVVPWPVAEAPARPRGTDPAAGSSARRPGV
jgi:iron complex transport system ATP-binding protein